MENRKIDVLLVDDNKEFTDLLTEYFELYNESGINLVGIANDGEEALKLIRALEPDVVVLDIIMPKLDGIEVLRKTSTFTEIKKPYFIMLSAVGADRIKQEALDLQAIYYIDKPFEMDVLISKIASLKC